ncbi:hypothetical protein Dsin_019551 [Dipteronia sinensis]|uniref:Uncharacterized protein n=1 Tax=Dipteronia sinensis TaxID=43782 RepID=A0AAE0A7R9_9ROSI|nr:hypothetical protein Dsin_019551 [Dipteronia sinensis]
MPILLRWPFMSTAKSIIDVHNGKLSMTALGETSEFEIFKSMKHPIEALDCFNIQVTTSEDKLRFALEN